MKRDDTLDTTRSKAWAWGAVPDDAALAQHGSEPAPEAPAEEEATERPPTEEDVAARREVYDTYAEFVEEAWRDRGEGADRSVAIHAIRKVINPMTLVALNRLHPKAVVRAARLLVSLWSDPEAREELDGIVYGLTFASFDHPEVADLLVEASRLGDLKLMWILSHHLDDDLARAHPKLGARLAIEVEQARTWRARAIALSLLSEGSWAEVVPSMRKALRWAHLRCRWVAVETLVERGAITADEVAWLLEDATAHPIDDPFCSDDEVQRRYERALLRAVTLAPPPGAVAALERLAQGRGVAIRRDRRFLARGWALEALAHIAPEVARGYIDHALRWGESHGRHDLVVASAALPEGLARPRLRALAEDFQHYVARSAREAWTARFGGSLPEDPFADVPMGLLDAAPSSDFEAHVRLLRGADREAPLVLARLVLASPPSRENLALALLVIRAPRYRMRELEGAPADDDAWVAWLRGRYGELAIEALFDEVRRGRDARRPLVALAHLAARAELSEPQVRAVSDLLLCALDGPRERCVFEAFYALPKLPPRPEVTARFEALLADGLEWHIAQTMAPRGPDAPLDARLAAGFMAARAARDWLAVERYGAVCIQRGVEPVIDALLGDLWSYEGPDGEPQLALLASLLRDEARIPDARIVDALEAPEAPRFARMAEWLPSEEPLRARAVERLKAALTPETPARAATAALTTLLAHEVIALDDPRVTEIYDRAPWPKRPRLLRLRMGRDPRDGRPWQPQFTALLTCDDPEARDEAMQDLWMYSRITWDDAWLDAMEVILPEGDRRDAFSAIFKRDTSADLYWIDDGE